MTAEKNKSLVKHFFEEVLNAHNLFLLPKFIASNYIEHSCLIPHPLSGIEGARQHIGMIFQAFSHLSFTLHDLIAEEGSVVARWTLKGLLIGHFLNYEGTGDPVEFSGVDIYRIEEGKIQEHWCEFNLFALEEQIK
jgi:predicted ester cyclase